MRATTIVIALIASLALCAIGYGNDIEYTVTDLGTLNGPVSVASYVNNNGWVAGWGDEDPVLRYSHAWVWPGSGALQNLGSFGGPQSVSIPTGLNDNNWVIGESDTANSGTHGFLWTGSGAIQDIGGFGGQFTAPNGINNAGTIVGGSETPDGIGHGFIYANGVMTDLGTTYIPTAINNSGQYAGYIVPADRDFSNNHAFLFSGGTYKDLGTLGGSESEAEQINDSGVVIGISTLANGEDHGFVYTDHLADLGTLGGPASFADGINAAGTVVGAADFDSARDTHGFIYNPTTGMLDLNTLIAPSLDLDIAGASGINNIGQIAAIGITATGQEHGFLLTPIDVPEPSPASLLLICTAAYFGRILFRRRRM